MKDEFEERRVEEFEDGDWEEKDEAGVERAGVLVSPISNCVGWPSFSLGIPQPGKLLFKWFVPTLSEINEWNAGNEGNEDGFLGWRSKDSGVIPPQGNGFEEGKSSLIINFFFIAL